MPLEFNYQQTFGSLSSCACEDCLSIYSPAAYLLDTLMFIKPAARPYLFGPQPRIKGGPSTVRRPDLGELQLNCTNTNTPLPYIDLVNEILEFAVAPNGSDPPTNPPPGGWWQTTGTADDLALVPEHVNDAAYAQLRHARYPWTVPFDLTAEQARAYLDPLGVRRDELLQAFLANPSDVTVGAEFLGLTPAELRIATARLAATTVKAATTQNEALSGTLTIDGVNLVEGDRALVKNQTDATQNGVYIVSTTGAWTRAPEASTNTIDNGLLVTVTAGAQANTRWFLSTPSPIQLGTTAIQFAAYVGPGAQASSGEAKWTPWFSNDPGSAWNQLGSSVQEVLDRSGLSYAELVEILTTAYINPDPTKLVKIQFTDTHPCDVSKATFQPALDDAALDRFHRFVRLQRRVGWTAHELDHALIALGAGDITDVFVAQLAYIERLRRELQLPVITLLAFWGTIDTRVGLDGGPSPYDRLFQNPAVFAAGATGDFALNAQRDELNDTTKLLSDHVPNIIAALGITGEEEALLENELGDGHLTLANLSALYRNATLAQALALEVADFVALKHLSGKDPFDGGKPSSTWNFLLMARKVSASGFRIAELSYLFANQYQVADGIAPTDDALSVQLTEIQVGLQKIRSDTQALTDPTGDLLRAKLLILFPVADYPTGAADALAFVKNAGVGEPQPGDFIVNHFGAFVDATDALDKLVTHPLPEDQRYAYLLIAYLRWSLSESFVLQKLSAAFKLDTKVVQVLLNDVVRSGRVSSDSKSSRFAMSEFLDDNLVTGADLTGATRTLKKLWKVALLLGRWKINLARLGTKDKPAWLLEATGIGWLDVNTLPLDSVTTADASLFAGWLKIVDFFSVWNRLPAGAPSLFDVLDSSSVSDYRTKLASRTGWSSSDLDVLVDTPNSLGVTFPNDFKDEQLLVRLQASFGLLRKLGVSAAQANSWLQLDTNDTNVGDARTIALEIRQAAKAKFDAGDWAQVAHPIQDRLRTRQRDALVAYLTADRGFADANDLFSWFLIDVEMGDCMMTSRLKQAISSTQLFIQRSLLNLEAPSTALSDDDAKQWLTWRKTYVIWAANRKVFLYPENYIEPELRDDNSPFFDTLQSELLQRELTLEAADDAFMHYLEKLDEVARLEIVGMYRDAAGKVLHVFGRTYNEPHVYFYRYQDNYDDEQPDLRVWSPWTKVDLDIAGDHLIPVVYNRRLHLFWPIFNEKPDDPAPPAGTTGVSNHLEIQIAWSEFKNGKWTAKRLSPALPLNEVSSQYLDRPLPGDPPYQPHRHYVFKATGDDPQGKSSGNLTIQVFFQDKLHIVNGHGYDEMDTAKGSFAFSGCGGPPTASGLGQPDYQGDINTPDGTEIQFMGFADANTDGKLTIQEADGSSATLLKDIKSPFNILVPHQDPQFQGDQSFFLQDQLRTFFARHVGTVKVEISDPKHVDFGSVIGVVATIPYEGAPPIGPGDPEVRVSTVDLESQASLGIDTTRTFGGVG